MDKKDFCLEGKVLLDNADKTVEKEQNTSAYMTFLLPPHCGTLLDNLQGVSWLIL
jgi:hypothetical protein